MANQVEEKQQPEARADGVDVLARAAEEFQQWPRREAEREARRDAARQRDQHDDEERGKPLREVGKIHAREVLHHHRARDDDDGRDGRLRHER